MLDDLKILFNTYTEAVICESGGIIRYMNTSAKHRIGSDLTGEEMSQIFPANLLESSAEVFSFTADLGGSICVSVCSLSEFRVFSIFETDEGQVHSNICTKVGDNLKHSVAILQMASGLIRSYVERAEDKQLSSYAAMMSHSIYSILRTADNIILHGCLQNDEPADFKDVFDMLPLCSNLFESVSHFTKKNCAKLRFETQLNEAAVRGDRRQIEQALLCLLSNSFKYTSNEGIVTISLSCSMQNVVISVSDTGEGIPEHVMRSVFERYKEPYDAVDVKRGIGLGLSIVRYIAHRHRGNLLIESRLGVGTKATLILPAAEPDEFMADSVSYESADLSPILTALSDVLTYDFYYPEYLD